MKTYRRSHSTQVTSYRAPTHRCFACHDTGIVQNSDGRLNTHAEFSDYDHRFDIPVICCCAAAFPRQIQDDQGESQFTGGYRGGAGIHTVDDYTGTHKVGVDCPKHIVADLDQHRREVWAESEREVKLAKAENRKPWFIDETKDHLKSIGSILESIRPEDNASTKFHSQNPGR